MLTGGLVETLKFSLHRSKSKFYALDYNMMLLNGAFIIDSLNVDLIIMYCIMNDYISNILLI